MFKIIYKLYKKEKYRRIRTKTTLCHNSINYPKYIASYFHLEQFYNYKV